MKSSSFPAACILVCALLVRAGAPILAVASGAALAGLWYWKGQAMFRAALVRRKSI